MSAANPHPAGMQLGEVTVAPASRLARFPIIAGLVGLVALGAAAALGWSHAKQFYHSYLTAYLFFLSITLGGLFFVLLQYAVKAGWSVVVRRISEHAMVLVPLFVLLFIPIIFGMGDLFKWSKPEVVAADHMLKGKTAYLNTTFFYIRAAIYFAIWGLLAWFFYRRSIAQDRSGDPALTSRMQVMSGPGIVLFGLSITFAAFDWIMSLDAHWYSTIFGAYFFTGALMAILAFIIVIALVLRGAGLLREVISTEHFHDLGKLLFAFTMFWSYLAFSQYFLIWYANMPEETLWFYHRMQGSWKEASIILALGHFVVPFFFLMTRITKRRTGLLLAGALWMLAMHYLDLYWLVLPNLHHHGVHFSVIDLLTLVGVGGVFLAGFGFQLRRHNLIPRGDPRLPQSVSFENV